MPPSAVASYLRSKSRFLSWDGHLEIFLHMKSLAVSIRDYLSLVRFNHTLFALPFAALGFTLGCLQTDTLPGWEVGIWVLLCMVFARNAAMAFNRLIDAAFDGLNPRTAIRELPAGILSHKQVSFFVLFNCLAFVATTALINPLCFLLSPVALGVVLGYSYTKRFTPLCHLILGVGLGLAPVGAYLAVTGSFALLPIVLGLAVLFWVAGFDVIYALQDENFDRHHRLHSLPAWLGGHRALVISRWLHVTTACLIVFFSWGVYRQMPVQPGLLAVADLLFVGMLVFQHAQVRPGDLRKVNLAFFTANGLASLGFGLMAILSLVLA